ncbi:MAG: ATPase [Sphingomonas sp. SCN 67-18]|uniref:SRPBCC family protein n=1 Tax=uncultured Sphingomonas sp. TaxID=158754 RepID=UPI00086BF20F|nr:SRPBCC family protein [Sphingomonas sp. SCN 67-18]ODU21959.1 MAG: ATPase [Sphingomonas sp. SCN 67-18]
MNADTGYELAIERRIAATPARVWQVWTLQLEQWWAPRPWQTRVIELDLRPGGRSCMEMSGPGGEVSVMEGVVLEIVPERRIVFTNAFRAGWIPQTPFMVGLFSFAADGDGTLYRAASRHWDEATMKQHEEMGFQQGWAQCAAQLAEIAEAG